ncbi:MAG: hypothetical protein K9I94_04280 [Bacteroidales bacterium]|nr:hypothetical protein [Bacteroidales bacterium]
MKYTEKYIDCLIADSQQIKQEIHRRSNLQKAVLTGYIGLLSFTFAKVLDDNLKFELVIVLLICLFLIQLYYYREWIEIARLGKIISTKIAREINDACDLKDTKKVYHSQTDNQFDEIFNFKYTSRLSKVFNWIFLGLLPLIISIFFLNNKNYCISIGEWIVLLFLNLLNIGFIFYTEHYMDKKIKYDKIM